MKRAFLLISYVILFIALYKIDKFLIPTLDYFGKYVFFILLNLSLIYILYKIFFISKGVYKVILPLIFSSFVFILSLGV